MVTCKFSCNACGCKHVPFLVRHREPDEDILDWMESAVRPALGAAHRLVGPACQAQTADLMVPIDERAPGVGMKPVLDS